MKYKWELQDDVVDVGGVRIYKYVTIIDDKMFYFATATPLPHTFESADRWLDGVLKDG